MDPETTYVGTPDNEEGVVELEIVRVNEDSRMAEVSETRVEHPERRIQYVKPLSEIAQELDEGILRE